MSADMGTFDNMPVAALRHILDARHVDYSGCIEKGELVALCKQQGGADISTITTVTPGVFHDIEQNSTEWFHMRRGKYGVSLGASEVGTAIGISAYAKPYSLWQKITGQADGTWENGNADDETPPPCAHGHLCEPLIAGMYAHYLKRTITEGGFYQASDADLSPFYGASPDRRVMGEDGTVAGLLEIKAPYGRMYTNVKQEYMAQMQFQMWCAGFTWCDFLAIKLDHDTPEKTIPSKIRVFLTRVHRSDEYIKWMLPRLFLFTTHLVRRTCPPRNLYDSEAMGYEPIPNVRQEVTPVETGAWLIQPPA